MHSNKILPESELDIMLVIWEMKEPITSNNIMKTLNKNWKKPTLLNLLTRLCKRGFLDCERTTKCNVYKVLISREDYSQEAVDELLQKMFNGSITDVVRLLSYYKKISKNDLESLKKICTTIKAN